MDYTNYWDGKERRKRQQAEPVAWMRITLSGFPTACNEKDIGAFPVYTAPPADDDTLAFVERWAVHHVKTQGAEAAIGVIANHPVIKAITQSLGEQTPPYPADDEAVRSEIVR